MKILSTILPTKPLSKFKLKMNFQRSLNEKLMFVEKPIVLYLKSHYRTAEEKLNLLEK